MNETFASTRNLPRDMVLVDPHLEHLLGINLLDHEPDVAPRDLEPPRFRHVPSRAEERISVPAR